MAKIISLFNHKGGVSKTTTAFNLGWALADLGKRVLLVDLDPQCNLTGLILGYAKLEDGLDTFYQSRENLTLSAVLDALIDGQQPEMIADNDHGSLFQTQNKNLALMPGSLDISEMDSQISLALKISAGVPVTRNLPSSLPRFIKRKAENEGFDYIILDLSPSVGGLNEVMLMSSDYFIVPTAPDFFCWQAVRSLSNHLKAWHSEIQNFKDQNQSKSAASIANTPLFLGTIQQRYRIRKKAPAKSFGKWIDAIKDAVDQTLIPCLEKFDCVIPRTEVQRVLAKYASELEPYDLAHISDFNSLIAISQNVSKPVFALTDEDLATVGKQFGWALKTMQDNRDNFAKTFDGFAKIIVALTSKI